MRDKNKTGVTWGLFFAIFHAIWALAVAIMPGTLQSFLDWVFHIHFLERVWILTSFNFLNALVLVVFTFVVGYVLGWVYAWADNMHHKNK